MQRDQFAAQRHERGEQHARSGGGDARVIRFQEFGIAAAIGGCVQHGIDIVEQVARTERLGQVTAPVPRRIEQADLFGLGLDEVLTQIALLAARDAVFVGELDGEAEALRPRAVDVGASIGFAC